MNISSLNNPVISNPGGNNSLLPQANSASSTVEGSSQRVPGVSALDISSLQDKRQTALQIVNRTLTLAYEKISSRAQVASAEYQAFEPLTAEKVANNILGFIERRLQLDVAEGANQEALNARLDAGLSGFKKGFAEATEKLEALSLFAPEVQSDIDKTYDLVLTGVDELRNKFIQSMGKDIASLNSGNSAERITSAEVKKPDTKLEVPSFLPAASSYLGYGNYEYGRAREFSFELTTKEGDKVTIKASSSEGVAIEAGRVVRGGDRIAALNASYSTSQSFSLFIDGELSEQELGAINDLLGRVNNLAGEFFTGDLDVAFEQAINLGYDAQQIASYSLNLAQVEIQQVTQAYQAFEPNEAESGNRPQLLVDQLLPLGNFIKDLLASLDRASEFSEPRSLITTMAEKMPGEDTEVNQQQGKRFHDFIEQLFVLDLA